MIIKDDKLAQAEADAEPHTETPPPYSLAPAAGVTPPTRPQPQPLSQSQSRSPYPLSTPSSASLAPSSSSTAVGSASGSGPSREATGYPYKPPPRELARTGFVNVQRVNSSVKERVVVDPYIPFPSFAGDDEGEGGGSFGAGTGTGTGRRNVRIEAKDGNVDAEVWVVGPGADGDGPGSGANGGEGRKKAGIDIRAKNGFVQVKIHTPPSTPPPPFSLRITAKNGGIRIALPRTFAGPLTTHTTNGWLALSPALSSHTTIFSDVRGTRKAFVGDFVESSYGRGEWLGSSVEITCDNGRLKMYYLDEENETRSSALLGRLVNMN